jgi:integrase/recombinase XerD
VLDEGPRDLLVRPKVAVTSFGRYLDEGELRRLVDAARECSPRHHATVMLLFGCGLRVSEAVSAVWRDLYRDPDGCLGLRVVGKGSKERVVLVPDATFRALAALHGSDRLDAKDRSPLLVSSRGGPYTDRQLRRLVDQAAKAAGLDKAVSPHWLRHTSATLAARHGAPAYAIQASLGHTSLATSQRYVHWAKGLEGQATGYLDAVLAG